MITIQQTEIETILDAIDLAIGLTMEQRKALSAYFSKLLSHYKDPKRALEELLIEAERITNKEIHLKERKKIDLAIEKQRKLANIFRRQATKQITQEEALTIVNEAAKKLSQKLNKNQQQEAVKGLFKKIKVIDNQKLNANDSLAAKANAALTSVLEVGLNITVTYNPGNPTGIIFYKPFQGLAPIDQNINETGKILDFIKKNALNGKELTRITGTKEMSQETENPSNKLPSPSPFSSTSTNPFKGGKG